MNGKAHLSVGLLSATVLATYGQPLLNHIGYFTPSTAGVIIATAVGSLFPDIDLQTSKMGNKTKPVSFIIQHTFGHRTLFHSPILYALICFLIYKYLPSWNLYNIGFTIGAISHLVLDMFNEKGIPLLYPLNKKFHFACFSADSMLVNNLIMLGSLLGIVIILFSAKIF